MLTLTLQMQVEVVEVGPGQRDSHPPIDTTPCGLDPLLDGVGDAAGVGPPKAGIPFEDPRSVGIDRTGEGDEIRQVPVLNQNANGLGGRQHVSDELANRNLFALGKGLDLDLRVVSQLSEHVLGGCLPSVDPQSVVGAEVAGVEAAAFKGGQHTEIAQFLLGVLNHARRSKRGGAFVIGRSDDAFERTNGDFKVLAFAQIDEQRPDGRVANAGRSLGDRLDLQPPIFFLAKIAGVAGELRLALEKLVNHVGVVSTAIERVLRDEFLHRLRGICVDFLEAAHEHLLGGAEVTCDGRHAVAGKLGRDVGVEVLKHGLPLLTEVAVLADFLLLEDEHPGDGLAFHVVGQSLDRLAILLGDFMQRHVPHRDNGEVGLDDDGVADLADERLAAVTVVLLPGVIRKPIKISLPDLIPVSVGGEELPALAHGVELESDEVFELLEHWIQ